MSNYVKATDFASKDSLETGDAEKLIKGTEINTEFNNIQTSIATKADLASPAFTGNPTATTQAAGNNTSRLATTAFVASALTNAQANVNITGGTIDGVTVTDSDITGGTISELTTDIVVADGGTGRSTLTANSLLVGNGVDPVTFIAPGTAGNVLVSDGEVWESVVPAIFGVGQTWQDVKASRVKGTTYTNSTGKPIMVNIEPESNGNALTLTVGGVTVAHMNTDPGASATMSVVVPNGTTYVVTGNENIALWAELR